MGKKYGNFPVNVACRVGHRRHQKLLPVVFVLLWQNRRQGIRDGGMLPAAVDGREVLLFLPRKKVAGERREMLRIRTSCGMIQLVVPLVLHPILVLLGQCL
jgi:hypothetical protein